MNGTSTYIEFNDQTEKVSLHLPHGDDDENVGPLQELAAMLFFALNDDDCELLIDEIKEILLDKMYES